MNSELELDGPPKVLNIRPMTFGTLFREPFWLVPLAEPGSNISVSVMTYFPAASGIAALTK